MKIVTIGDIHSRQCWKNLVKEVADLYIFVGDYVDSFTHTDKEIIDNLLDIIYFAQNNNTILLKGNHDIQYEYGYDKYGCSGYRISMLKSLQDIFFNYKDLFRIAYEYYDKITDQKYLWTHAGITKRWWNKYENDINTAYTKDNYSSLSEILNDMPNNEKFRDILFECGEENGGYRYNVSGPLWARPNDHRQYYPFDSYHQIVGHTPHFDITTYNKFMDKKFDDRSITFVDCLDKINKSYIMH